MKLKIALSAATAMGLLMGSAYAGSNNVADIDQLQNGNTGSIDQNAGNDNVSKFKQDGNNNTATVRQTGDRNVAGRNNNANPLYGRMWQTGDHNSIDILQTENGNGIVQYKGANFDGNPYTDGNFYQEGDRNEASITQRGGTNTLYGGVGNGVDEINQIAPSTASGVTNRLTIEQSGVAGAGYARNYILSVNQKNEGGATNTLSLIQKDGNFANENLIRRVDQVGTGNTGEINQTGGQNMTVSLSQDGSGNDASIMLNGFGNGSDGQNSNPRSLAAAAFTADTLAVNSPAGEVGIQQGVASQNGTGNNLGYSVTGSNNRYGFVQTGDGNSINGVVTGDLHEVAIHQIGGDDNVVDFDQSGQSGTGNNLGVSMNGADNHVKIKQSQLDADGLSGNKMAVSITGSDNNNWPTSGNLTDDARDAYDVANLYDSSFIGQGSLYQIGSDNTLSMTVSTDLNSFATYQNGEGNTITHGISGGGDNQAVIVQIGNSNVSNTSQVGGGNNLGIIQ